MSAQFSEASETIMRLILASSSPRRQALLSQLALRFDVIKPNVDESRRGGEGLIAYAERLSRDKAMAVADALSREPVLIISADTIVALDADGNRPDAAGEMLGKPADPADARRMLRRLRQRAHLVITAFTLYRRAETPRLITRHATTIVHMRNYSDEEIDTYIASGDPMDKAGAYAIQNADFAPVARIEGSYSNVVGLPLEALKTALEEFDIPNLP